MMLELPTKPIVVHNEDFQSVIIRVMFPYYEEEKDLAKLAMLSSMLTFMNNKYPTEEEFQKVRKKNYILNVGCSKAEVGSTMFLCFSLVIPDKEALGFDNIEKQLIFFKEAIYNPKVIDEGFDAFEFERELRNIKLGIENSIRNPKTYRAIKSLELVDDEGILSRSIFNHQDQFDELTPQNLYKFYLDIIGSYCPKIYIFGNVEEKEICPLVEKYLYPSKVGSKTFETRYCHFLKPRDTINYIDDKTKFKDSSVTLFYKIKDMREDDFKYLTLIKSLLNSLSSRMLNKKLRDENDLVYSSKASTYLRFGLLEVFAYINKDNKDFVIEKIKEVMDDLRNPNNIKEYLDNIKERRRIGLISVLDDKFALFSDYIFEDLKIEKSMNDDYQDILKISAYDISKFMDRLVLDTVYFMEEDSHE